MASRSVRGVQPLCKHLPPHMLVEILMMMMVMIMNGNYKSDVDDTTAPPVRSVSHQSARVVRGQTEQIKLCRSRHTPHPSLGEPVLN